MTHAGKARQAGLKIIFLSLLVVGVVLGLWSLAAGQVPIWGGAVLVTIWLILAVFSLSFFRDPEAQVPVQKGAFVSPAHGTVDLVDETVEKVFMGGRCRRISIFLSVFDVHVQNAPVSGRIAYLKHCPGRFVNAMRSDCGDYNENVLVGIESGDAEGERVAVRLIAGLLARRIVPWVSERDELVRGQRIGLIQFGSRVDLYLPMTAKIEVRVGERVKGGETVVAIRT